ncbi:branched-chain amino acid ABC transporter substrate-binding protein [Streptomyces sp. H10-C2]|uniref:branched-chain amino acid ABC transporter substrate-binding protein n=1 Tax=unclassified Streptomyces TaxID=2593676 RepID=UPI0024B947E2|nr:MULTISPECIES: branched-chain amino acid ABC transporter substrate-binding protein [unclassified Streptomyces]MDJ0341021.1 branched-chain amino acid ABC transporter substrate-binding protein [Streptomyces sp. PH10-H1]MDJ0369747.1 branched-chain amino acid ABC transporter substrate-binding protein [Streptomyces sp. H10-C2]
MRNRTIIMAGLPLATGALLLSACSSNKGGGGGGKPSYTIAFQGPLTGPNAQLGINEDFGVRLALQQANAKGDLPFTLKFKDADDQGDPAKGPSAAQQLIGDSSVVAVVGPTFSGPTKSAEPLFTQANLASVSASATNSQLTSLGFKTFWRVVPPDSAQGSAAADYIAKKLKAKKVYVLDDKSDYGVGLADNVKSQLVKNGAQVVTDSVAAGTNDYSAVATKIANSGADALYYAGYYADAAPLAKSLKQTNFAGTPMSGDGTNDPKFVQLGGAAANGWQFTCPCLSATAATDATAKAFVAAYTKLANQPPGTYSPEAYDTANTIISVMKSIGKDVTRAKVVDGLKTVDYKGLTKQIKFLPNGEVSEKGIFIYGVKDNKITLIGTVDKLIAGS